MLRIAVLLVVVGVALAEDQSASAGGVEFKAKGQSGKFELSRASTNSSLTFEFDYLTEKNSAGDGVGTSGTPKHSFNSFASKTFSFKPKDDSATLDGVKATKIVFEAVDLLASGVGKLTVTIYIFKEAGNVTVMGSEYSVKTGNMKFNVALEGWKYCGETGYECKQGQTVQVGEFVELGITLKTPNKPKKDADESSGSMVTFELGENEKMIMDNKLSLTNSTGTFTVDMDTGYPDVVEQGAKQTLKIQLKKGTKVEYDPVVDMQGEEGDDNNNQGGGDSSGASTVTASLLSLIMAALYSMY